MYVRSMLPLPSLLYNSTYLLIFSFIVYSEDDMDGSRDTAVGITFTIKLPFHDSFSYLSYKRLLVSEEEEDSW